jgi:NAD+ diphosphatase
VSDTGGEPSGYAFATRALDRASERREDPAWLEQARRDPSARCVVVRPDGKVIALDQGQRLARLPFAALAKADDADASFLGLDEGAPVFALRLAEPAGAVLAQLHEGEFRDLRSLAATLSAAEAGLAAYARALFHWQSRKRHCGSCGAPTRLEAAGHRARCSDTACNQEYFPRTDPAIIVIVHRGDRCLLGRQAAWPERGFSTLAGFVEPGETLEHAVQREVAEETGVHVGACRYRASQPWPFPASLMLGFEAEAQSDRIAVGAELAEARWFEAARMPELIARGELALSPAISIAFHLINGWYRERTGGSLPPGKGWVRR